MEKEIQMKLIKIYKNLEIKVDYPKFRQYNIYINIDNKGVIYSSMIEFIYDNYLSFNANINKIIKIIDSIILDLFKKGEINERN